MAWHSGSAAISMKGNKYTPEQLRILRDYARSMQLALDPDPVIPAEGVQYVFKRMAARLAEYVANSEGTLYVPQIPKGGRKVTTNVLQYARGLVGNEIDKVHVFDVLISRYGSGGTEAREPRLPEGFRLAPDVAAGIRGRRLPIFEDIGDELKTLNLAADYLAEIYGIEALNGHLLIDRRAATRDQSGRLEVIYVGYVFSDCYWYMGGECLDFNSLGRNIKAVYKAYDHIVKPERKLPNGFLAELSAREAEDREDFNLLLEKLQVARVDGMKATDFIEGLPPMDLEELLTYL